MPGSKYERELRFIDSEARRLGVEIQALREAVPDTPMEAEANAARILDAETRLAGLLQRRDEIERSFVEAGLDVPDVGRSMNVAVYKEGGAYEAAPPRDETPRAQVKPEADLAQLSAEIESVTEELMGLEIKMLRADMDGDDEGKQKLQMMASSLRSRRDSLVEAVKRLKAEERAAEEPEALGEPSELERRIEALEADNRALRRQVSDVRTDVGEVKESLRQIMRALGIND